MTVAFIWVCFAIRRSEWGIPAESKSLSHLAGARPDITMEYYVSPVSTLHLTEFEFGIRTRGLNGFKGFHLVLHLVSVDDGNCRWIAAPSFQQQDATTTPFNQQPKQALVSAAGRSELSEWLQALSDSDTDKEIHTLNKKFFYHSFRPNLKSNMHPWLTEYMKSHIGLD